MRHLVVALAHPRDYKWWELRPWQRHSLVLAVAGFVYVALGCIYAFGEMTEERAESLEVVLNVAPITVWGWLWIVVGILALISSRWPPASKTWGYGAMSGLAAGWAAAFLLAGAFLGALVFALLAFLWWAIAGLTNPDDLHAMIDDPIAWGHSTEGGE